MTKHLNLYRVHLRGMGYGMLGEVTWGEAYVVAEDAESAYQQVKTSLEERNIGTDADRALSSVELMAEAGRPYPKSGRMLYLPAACTAEGEGKPA